MLPEAGYKEVSAEYGKVYFDSRITEISDIVELGFKDYPFASWITAEGVEPMPKG
ncbi:MAG TPA: hypothetical protein PLM92_02930 [Bacillota bacterium]|nr:hypothetical protein [Bacillota bacterium]HUM56401.1 hypothetical protein [Bacillota bacterium]